MKKIIAPFKHLPVVSYLFKWIVLATPVSITIGSVVALFLWLLDKATTLRYQNSWLLFLLPLAGIIIHFLYKYSGKNAEAGNNLIIDEIHEPGGGVPARMGPLVVATTLITHLFGGSAGREGTAVQVGGSFAGLYAKWFKLTQQDVTIILMAGVAAGFGAVFGTPLTGTIFALEVVYAGRINYKAILPCLLASILADITCTAWGIHHTQYHIAVNEIMHNVFSFIHFDGLLLLKAIAAGACFGIAGFLFSELTHSIKNYSNQFIKTKWLIPFIGGLVIIVLTYALGSRDYLGLGVSNPDSHAVTIVSCFNTGGATHFSWLWKIIFTAVTIGMGFKGGEVTPLFFIGAALGNTLALLSGAPVDLMAGLGFIAVFAGATNTPLACTIMGAELFGSEYLLYYAVACFMAHYFSGPTGIYTSQRIKIRNGGDADLKGYETLKDARNARIKKFKLLLKRKP